MRLGVRREDGPGTEALTGCLTRRGLERAAPVVRRLADRRATSVAVVTIEVVDGPPPARRPVDASDVDTGIAVVADVLRVSVRTTDRIARTSPRRFAVLLAGEHGYVVDTAERLHRGTLRGLRRIGLRPRVGMALRRPGDCDGPVADWVDGLVDEAVQSVRFGG